MLDDKLHDEEGRIAALHRYEILDTAEEEAFSRIANLVQMVLCVPISAVALVDRDRQTFKAVRGMSAADLPRQASFGAQTIRAHQPLQVPDASADPRFADNPLVLGAPHIRGYLGFPLTTPDGYNIGSLCAIDTEPRQFDASHAAVLESLAKLAVEFLELRQIAKHDSLTNALTRRGFFAEVEKDFMRSTRYERPSALVVIDIDHFRAINDLYGHPCGDDVITAVARCCNETLRHSDAFGRIGGEEFALLLPETSAIDAMQCAERIRVLIEALRIKSAAGPITVTASFGVAPLSPDVGNPDQWFVEADIALYEAKRDGRNRCVSARPRRRNLAPLLGGDTRAETGMRLH